MARTRRRAQRQGWGGGGAAHPLPPPSQHGIPWMAAWHPCTPRTRSPLGALGDRGSGRARATPLPFLSAHAAGGSWYLNNSSPGHGAIWRGINAFFSRFFPSCSLSLQLKERLFKG